MTDGIEFDNGRRWRLSKLLQVSGPVWYEDATAADLIAALQANPQLRASVLSAIPGIVVLDEADFHASIKRDLDAFSAQAERTEKAESELARQLTELQGMYAAFDGSGHAPKNAREAAQAIGQMHDAEAELAVERARVVEQEEARCEVTSDFADVANWLLTCNWHLPGFVHDRISKLKQRLLAAPGSSEQAAPAQHDSSSIRSKAAQEGPGACNRVAPGNAVAPRRGDSGRLRAEQAASSAGDVCGVPYNDDERCCSQRHGHGGQHSFVDGPIEVFWGDPSPAKPELPGGEDFLAEAERCWVGEDNSSALWAVICHLRALEAK